MVYAVFVRLKVHKFLLYYLFVYIFIYLFYFCVRVGGVRTISNRRILHMELTITNDNELKINYRWFYRTLWIVVFVTRNCRFDMSI